MSTMSGSTSESPTSPPCARSKVNAIAPPTRIVSHRSRSASITPSLSLTFAPPSTATNGRGGSCRRRESTSTSCRSRLPAALGSTPGGPTMDACARCDAPNASLTYRSAVPVSAAAKPGSFSVSPGSKRRFSSMATAPAGRSATTCSTFGPTTAGASGTSAPSSSPSRRATGAIESRGSGTPFGPPEMTAHDDDRPVLSQRRDRRHGGRDAKVVLDLAVAQRHVEVDPHEHARPAPHVEVVECRELHAVTAAPRSSRYPTKATMSTSRLEYPHSLSYQPRILTMLPFDIVSMAE